MNDLPRETLCQLVSRYGDSLCEDPRRCEALLRDLCGQYQREIAVLVTALQQRVAADLLASQEGVPQQVLFARLAQRLHDNVGMAKDLARWAVETWAFALGVSPRQEQEAEGVKSHDTAVSPPRPPVRRQGPGYEAGGSRPRVHAGASSPRVKAASPPLPPAQPGGAASGRSRAQRPVAGLSGLPPFIVMSVVTAAVLVFVLPLIVLGATLLTENSGGPTQSAGQPVAAQPTAQVSGTPLPVIQVSTDEAPTWGPADAKVTVIEFADYQ